MHEITTDVEIHGIARLSPVQRCLPDVLAQSVYAVVCATAFDAGVRVGNESALKELVSIVEVEMMHDAIAEHGSEHLALLGIADDESTWKAGPCIDHSEGRRIVRRDCPSGDARISQRSSSCAYDGPRRRMPHKGQTITVDV